VAAARGVGVNGENKQRIDQETPRDTFGDGEVANRLEACLPRMFAGAKNCGEGASGEGVYRERKKFPKKRDFLSYPEREVGELELRSPSGFAGKPIGTGKDFQTEKKKKKKMTVPGRVPFNRFHQRANEGNGGGGGAVLESKKRSESPMEMEP